MKRRALLMVNRQSRDGVKDLDAALQVFRGAGLEWIERDLGDSRGLGHFIQSEREAVDCVVLGGGDGTMQRAASALLRTGLPLGILPLGTANDLARTLGIPMELASAAELIVSGRLRKIDLTRANDAFFFNVAHIGLGARIRKVLSPEVKQRWGNLSYARALVESIKERRPFEATVKHDAAIERFRSIEIAVGNGRYYGGGMAVSEHAGIDDARLHVYSIAPVSLWKLIRSAVPLMRGATNDPEAVQKLTARGLVIETERPMAVVADGERITMTPTQFEVLPGAIPVYAHARKDAQ